MPTDATSLARGAGSTRSVAQLQLPPIPTVKLPEKLRQIAGAEAEAYERQLQQAMQKHFDRVLESIEAIRQQLRT